MSDPCVAERPETGFLLGGRREGVQEVAGGSGQAVEPRHHQHIAGIELVDQAAKLSRIGLGSACRFAEHLARRMFPQRRDLRRDTLAVRRDPRVPVNHGITMCTYSATEKANDFSGPASLHISWILLKKSREG